MSEVLLALWIALIGADRVDFAGGHGPFVVTPFLALTPIVMASELWRHTVRRQPVTVSRSTLSYAAAAAALAAVTLVSVFRAQEMPVSASRTILLIADVAGTFGVALLCTDRRNLWRILAWGAIGSLALYAAFDVMQALWFAGRGPELVRVATATARFNALQSIGPLPRLAGPVADGNRAGFVLLFYIVVIAGAGLRPATRRTALGVAIVLLAVTLSRSASMAALATGAMALIARRRRVSPALLLATSTAIVLTTAYLFAYPRRSSGCRGWYSHRSPVGYPPMKGRRRDTCT